MHTPQTHDSAERTLRQLEAQARQQAAWRKSGRGEAIHRFPTHDVDRQDTLTVHWGDLPDEETGELGLGLRFRYVIRFAGEAGEIISRETAREMLKTPEERLQNNRFARKRKETEAK